MARRQERPQLRINRQTPATRCDICHQSDNYDPINNRCSRCNPSLELNDDIVLVDDTENVLESLNNIYAQATQEQPTREENNSSVSQPPNTNNQQDNVVAPTPTLDNRRERFLDNREEILDRRQERIGFRELAFDQRQTALNEREQMLAQREDALDSRSNYSRNASIHSRLMPAQQWNMRLIGVVVVLVVCFLTMVGSYYSSTSVASTNKTSQLEPTLTTDNNATQSTEMQTEPETNGGDEEIPYKLELDSDPEKVVENPVVVLAVGNVTTLELDEAAKDIFVGNKEAVEVIKSATNPKKLYLIGKTPTSNSNIVIENASKTTVIFFQVVENASAGGFNGQVKVVGNKL